MQWHLTLSCCQTQCYLIFSIPCVPPDLLCRTCDIVTLPDCASVLGGFGWQSSLNPFHWAACMKPIPEEWQILPGKHLILYIPTHLGLKIQTNLTESRELLSVSGNKGSNSSTWRWYYLLLVSLAPFYEPTCMFDIKTALLMEMSTFDRSREIQSVNGGVRIHKE